MIISLIAAMSENGVIGKNNKLPWHIPEDLQLFKELTLSKPIVMGRKTFESIGKVLPHRTNIVLSGQGNFLAPPGVFVAHSIPEVMQFAKDAPELMIIGGAQIYQAFLPLASRLYLSIIPKNIEGDTFFPEIDWQEWELKHTKDFEEFQFKCFERKPL